MRHVLLPLLLLAAPAAAQAPSPPLTLAAALDLARQANPTAQAAEAGVQAARAAREVAALRPNPTVNAEVENVGGSRAYDVIEPQTQTLSLAYPLELGGKRAARVAVADAEGTRAAVDRSAAYADLRLAVTDAYVEVLAADRRLANAQDQAAIAADGLQAAKVRVSAGRASPLEESRAEVLRANADLAVQRATRLASAARQSLALSIGRSVPAALDQPWFDSIEHDGGSAKPGGLTVAAARADLAAAEARARIARSQRIPDVTISAGARRLPDNGEVAAVFGVSVPLPLFNNGSAALAQANAQRNRAEAMARAAEIDGARAMAKAEAERDNAAAAARSATGPALATAQEGARIARIGYREGKFGQLDLIEAERALAETRAAAIDALAAYHEAQAQLDRLTTPFDGAAR
jgi:cobalt-zinc-cadmium efflux system outer membrane protein